MYKRFRFLPPRRTGIRNARRGYDARAGGLQATFRLEAIRLRRAYMEDTFLGGSAGFVF